MHKVLIIGYGSIGERHARLLHEAMVPVACVTSNPNCAFQAYRNVDQAILNYRPTHVIVSNATGLHAKALAELVVLGWSGPVLVEKPLFDREVDVAPFSPLDISVAYNLRFHPVIKALAEKIAGAPLVSASFHVGQYLPSWRPGSDYRKSYSASNAAGGGVLRDLSHEIDLAQYFCGTFQNVSAIGGHFSNLEIEADDVFHLLGNCTHCPIVSVEMNYLNQMARRVICLNGNGFTAVADLVQGTLEFNGSIQKMSFDRDNSYRQQIGEFLGDQRPTLCTLKEGLAVDKAILAAERAASQGVWQSLTETGGPSAL